MARSCLFRFHFVILSKKPEIRPRKRPTEHVMHISLVGRKRNGGPSGKARHPDDVASSPIPFLFGFLCFPAYTPPRS